MPKACRNCVSLCPKCARSLSGSTGNKPCSLSSRPFHRLQLVDHGLDHLEALLPELALSSVEPEGPQQLGVVLGAARFQHVEVFAHEARMGVLVEAIERVHEAVAEGVG